MKLLADGKKYSTIIDAVNKMKNSEFKATAIKVELEAQLGRGNSDEYCGYCDEGYQECESCSGDGVYCDDCDETGVVEDDEGNEIECENCEGRGRVSCEDCDGSGSVTCGECGGDWQGSDTGDNRYCNDFILEQLVKYGLAEPIPDGECYDYGRKYRPKHPLVFSKFYNDGSVDSELTFTLMLDKPENIMLLPKFLDAFKVLAEHIGHGIDVKGAGMHMALLYDKNGYYNKCGANNTCYYEKLNCFANYQKSMNMLLPALYFLGTSNETTRRMHFRVPRIDRGDQTSSKYYAINFAYGALEFRVFDTCYDNPDVILDFVCVMANTMKYWRAKYIPFKMKGIKRIRFGNDTDYTLKRLYMKREVLDVLNGGLRILKPDYYTITELKKQRNFHVTKATVDSSERQRAKEVELEYKEYEQRFAWRIEIRKTSYLSDALSALSNQGVASNKPPKDYMKQAEREAAIRVKRLLGDKKDLKQYVSDRLMEIEEQTMGQYTLEVA